MDTKNMICNGEFVAPHGVRGEIRLYPYSDDPNQYVTQKSFYLEDGRCFSVQKIRLHKRVYVVQLEGITTVEGAESLRGKKIFVDKDSLEMLPEGEYYHFEIIGLPVFHLKTGEKIGQVVNIIHTGANDVYEILPEEGKPILLPAIRDVIQKIDLKERRIEVLPQEEW